MIASGLDVSSIPLRCPAVVRVVLGDFRSYASLDLAIAGLHVVLTGENGAGKTNLLEALSMLTQGRGLRRAEAGELPNRRGSGGWSISIALGERGREASAIRQLGTGVDPPDAAGGTGRRCRIDRASVPSTKVFAEHLRIVWLTPAMDALFAGPGSDRRRFLDRIVLTLDADHATRVNALDRALRNRNKILEDSRSGPLDRAWADAAEREVASLGVAVAAARVDTVARLRGLIDLSRNEASPFPWAEVALNGVLEDLVEAYPALEAEDRYRELLRRHRGRDTAAGRTTVGPHLTDLAVRHGPKGIEAARASTGEQKALVVGLVLAQARLVAAMSGIAPLVLLDEIAAHFDPARRQALFAELRTLGGQVFMTGADPQAFAHAEGAERFTVADGRVVPG